MSKDRNQPQDEKTEWDNTVYFGIGRPKGNHHTGFHTVNGQGVFSGMVWRGDARPPNQVFKTGFSVQKAVKYVSGRETSKIAGVSPTDGTTRGVVSASEDMWMGAHWAAQTKPKNQGEPSTGWVYLIKMENEPWAASTLANAGDSEILKKTARSQREIMFAKIPPESIVGARKVQMIKGVPHLLDEVVLNKKFQGNLPAAELINDDLGLKKFYDPSRSVSANPTAAEFAEIIAKEEANKSRSAIPVQLREKPKPLPKLRQGSSSLVINTRQSYTQLNKTNAAQVEKIIALARIKIKNMNEQADAHHLPKIKSYEKLLNLVDKKLKESSSGTVNYQSMSKYLRKIHDGLNQIRQEIGGLKQKIKSRMK